MRTFHLLKTPDILCANDSGTIAGYYVDSNNAYHGFVRNHNGHITPINVLGAGTGAYQGTWPYGSNSEGAIAGRFLHAIQGWRGQLLTQLRARESQMLITFPIYRRCLLIVALL